MPRPKRVEPVTPNAVIASAARLGEAVRIPKRQGTEEWQAESWRMLDICGELRYAANWVANALSRVRLYPEVTVDGGDEELTEGPALDVLRSLFHGESGQSQMMADFGVHLTVPGEAYLFGVADDTTGRDEWAILSTEEIERRAGRWVVDRGDGDERVYEPEAVLVIRIWRSHPRKWVEADSPVRAVLPVLRELEQLTKHVGATIDSRLAGAGLLLLPSEMTFSVPPVEGATPENPADDPFMARLAEAMIQPIEDRGNASAVVPIVVRAPGAILGNAQFISFATPLSEAAQSLRMEAIRRIALGMDMPPEVLLGTADVNHWGAWQIDEAALKTHIEPACELICDALTRRFLLPALTGMGATIDPTLRIGFDTSDLRLRPNRSGEAVTLYDRLELTGGALRRETGFEESDAPDQQELADMLLKKAALGATAPEVTAAAMEALGADLYSAPSSPQSPSPAPASTPGPTPPPVQGPAETLPGPPEQQAAALLAAAEPLVLRAIERAHNKATNRSKTQRPIPAARLDEAMKGAFHMESVGRVARYLRIPCGPFLAAIDSFAREVLTTGEPYDPVLLASALNDLTRLRAVPSG